MMLPAVLLAQKGKAPHGNYPNHYYGETYRGKVVTTSEDETMVLVYQKGDKLESFEAELEAPCDVLLTTGRTDRGPKTSLQALC